MEVALATSVPPECPECGGAIVPLGEKELPGTDMMVDIYGCMYEECGFACLPIEENRAKYKREHPNG
jgi:hypothetical protein